MDAENIPENISEFITLYLSEKERLSTTEMQELTQWINKSTENRNKFAEMQEIWFAGITAKNQDKCNKDQAYQRFVLRMQDSANTRTARKRRFTVKPVIYGIAGVVILLIVSYASFKQGGEILKSKFADVVIESPSGSRMKMYLPDGSLVWLNAGSIISYSQGFGINERNIELTGEGYFEVQKNPKIPLSVNTKELNVKVLGTRFNFKNYPDDLEATVSLLEGKVKVNNTLSVNNSTELSPGQKVLLDKKTGKMEVITVDTKHENEWTNGLLFFDGELLPDIVRDLERIYNVQITIKDEDLKTMHFHGEFDYKEYSIEDILEYLSSTGKFKYTVNGKNIELSSNQINE